MTRKWLYFCFRIYMFYKSSSPHDHRRNGFTYNGSTTFLFSSQTSLTFFHHSCLLFNSTPLSEKPQFCKAANFSSKLNGVAIQNTNYQHRQLPRNHRHMIIHPALLISLLAACFLIIHHTLKPFTVICLSILSGSCISSIFKHGFKGCLKNLSLSSCFVLHCSHFLTLHTTSP